jgi:hypothetical protein
VACEDRWCRSQVREESVEIEAREVGRGRCRQCEAVAAHEFEHRRAFEPSERINDRALDERKPERSNEAIEAGPLASRMMCRLDRGGEAEGGVGSGIKSVLPRNIERAAKLVEIFLVRQSG